MGAFNVVIARAVCAGCKNPLLLRVQFKYGDTWQHEYRIGDALKWGGNDIGTPGRKRVVVDGVAERCPKCGYEEETSFYVLLEHDIITSVEPASGHYDFAKSGSSHIVLDENDHDSQ